MKQRVNITLDIKLWIKACKKATRKGTSLSGVITMLLNKWLDKKA